MLTKAAENLMQLLMIGTDSNNTYGVGVVNYKNISGTLRYMSGGQNSNNVFPVSKHLYFNLNPITYGGGICVGSGSTPPAKTDYTLESMITTGLTGNVTFAEQFDNSKASWKFLVVLTNTSSNPIIVSEIGYMEKCLYSNSRGAAVAPSSSDIILFDRTVLESPVTISPNESKVIEYIFESSATDVYE